MAALQQHQLYYDTDCPLCVAYTGAMEKHGVLAEGSRVPFQQTDIETRRRIDEKRATSEIALLNTQNGTVQYGIDAMLHILFRNMPKLNALLHKPLLYSFLKKLYSFISYNRKVIAPAIVAPGAISCEPPLHKGWRTMYILFVLVFSVFFLEAYYSQLNEWMGLIDFAGREWYTSAGQIIWQSAALFLLVPSGKRWDYIGNLMTVSMIGTLMLIPMLILGAITSIAPVIYLGYFMLVVTYMLWEHSRRVKILKISTWLSVTWIAYRVLWAVFLMSNSF